VPIRHAISTQYKGYKFRSRLEARWAVFFDALDVKYVYEKEGFDLGELGRYLPDFWLPHVTLRSNLTPGLWAEVKPAYPDKTEESKYHAMAEMTGSPLVLLCGEEVKNASFFEFTGSWDTEMVFLQCTDRRCGHIRVEYGLESTYQVCSKCNNTATSSTQALDRAIKAARSARFEHGEQPCGT
jgi:hypothetical protein